MRPEDLAFIQQYFTLDKVSNPIIEIGSKIVTQHSGYNLEVRKIFKEFKYYGLDLEMGRNVDLLGDAECLPFKSNSIGTLICIGVLEHIKKFWIAMEEFYRILKKGGYLFVATVFSFPIHSGKDYWRFAPDGLSYLVQRFSDSFIVGEHSNLDGLGVWAVKVGDLGCIPPKGVYVLAKK